MASTVPWALYSWTLPSPATATVTRLAASRLAGTFRLDAVGTAPDGKTVRYVCVDGPVAVRFNTTAETCDAGTVLTPVIWTLRVELGPRGLPLLVSRTRVGARAWKPAPDGVSVSVAVAVLFTVLS